MVKGRKSGGAKKRRWRPPLWLQLVFGLVMLAGAAWLLRHELREYHFKEVIQALLALPRWRLALAAAATVLGYLALICHDAIALQHLRRSVPFHRVVLAGFITYAFSNSAPLSLVVAGGIRHRFYTRWGLGDGDTGRLTGLSTTTYALGLLCGTSIALTVGRYRLPPSLHLPFKDSLPLGVLAGLLLAGYLAWTLARGKALGARHTEDFGATLGFTASQIGVSMADWILSAWALYILVVPGHPLSFFKFFGVFMMGQIVALIAQSPGGLGVFDAVMVWGLAPGVSAPRTLAGLFAYRVIYHLLPLIAAAALLAFHEGRQLLHRRRK